MDNFALGLTNPSTQAELLKLEAWQTKITLYKDAVSDPGGGISPVSATWAKKHVLGMSDEEIKLDLQQQRFEKAISKELENTSEIIKKTGVFNQIDKLYGDIEATEEEAGDEGGLPGGEESSPPPPMGGMGAPPPPMDGGDAEPAAESYNVKRDLPLILENKGISLPNLEEMTKKANREIDKLNQEIDDLVKE